MRCPVCRQDQIIVEWNDVELDVCLEGHGLWFDAQELRMLLGKAGIPNADLELEESFSPPQSDPPDHPVRRCPRCQTKMSLLEAKTCPGFFIDHCPKSHGIWFDEGELEAWLAHKYQDDNESLTKIHDFLESFRLPTSSVN